MEQRREKYREVEDKYRDRAPVILPSCVTFNPCIFVSVSAYVHT